jgi:DNA topoisomerase-2
VLPLILVNGTTGIGSGWSTSVPSYNPVDVIAGIRAMLSGEQPAELLPWYRGFTGSIEATGPQNFLVKGKYSVDGDALCVVRKGFAFSKTLSTNLKSQT